MRIISLIENTEGEKKVTAAHGLSFYVETKAHRLVSDLGPSGETLDNAGKLGVDLKSVDIVVLSHGHYDHSGGIMSFARINPGAAIYMQESADGEYYASGLGEDGEVIYRYIGIDKDIANLPQVRKINGNFRIDDELELITVKEFAHRIPFTNKRILKKTQAGYIPDNFAHEHFLVIHEGGRDVLISGCAHSGVLNVMDTYKDLFGKDPYALISGFHLMKKSEYKEEEVLEIQETARKLAGCDTKIYTCHCTGEKAYDIMKDIMGQQLDYIHSGDEIQI